MTGLVLVFDLDQTLIDSHTRYNDKSQEYRKYLNITLIDTVLRPAVKLRDANKGVGCIFLLSNNGSEAYVKRVINELDRYLGLPEEKSAFDTYMYRYDSYREGGEVENPEKRLKDVENMLGLVLTSTFEEYSTENLSGRTYFFDDLATHTISKEIPEDHYFVIQGPDVDGKGRNMGFITGKPDFTDYRVITGLLNSKMMGGKRRYRKKTRKYKKRHTQKQRKCR